MRQEFLNNVSHELKTPIALVQGYAEGLKEIFPKIRKAGSFTAMLSWMRHPR